MKRSRGGIWGIDIPGWTGKSGGWVPALFDLRPFISDKVILRFAFASDMGFCTRDDPGMNGFFIDEITVSDNENVLFYNSADEMDGMTITGDGSEKARWILDASGRR
ncbi:MAG: immune inhibitor A [candidate division KSB1 bacterium]|nr:immune inhibitor A [candidate division KSB1 bacterium]